MQDTERSSWRQEPDPAANRQAELASIKAKGSFKGETLVRAEVEWLVEFHTSRMQRGEIDRDTPLDLNGADLYGLDLRAIPFANTNLSGCNLNTAILRGCDLTGAQLKSTELGRARLEDAVLDGVICPGATFTDAYMQHASLVFADLRSALMVGADLQAADLRGSQFGPDTTLTGTRFGGPFGNAAVGDVRWGGADLTVTRWGDRLGDEDDFDIGPRENPPYDNGPSTRLGEPGASTASPRDIPTGPYPPFVFPPYHPDSWVPTSVDEVASVRAYRQVSTQLRTQGMYELAARFAYRGAVHRQELLSEGNLRMKLRAVGLWLLDTFCGYGYRIHRVLLTYVVVIGSFSLAYWLVGKKLTVASSITLSFLAFHGRGLAGDTFGFGSVITQVTAAEAVLGLLVEAVFIASLTRKLFGD